MIRLLSIVFAVVSLAAAAPGSSSPSSVRLIHRVDVQVRAANGCRAGLGLAGYPVRRAYARGGVAFRRWSLQMWRARARSSCAEYQRVGVPSWFRNVMLCIHPKESADWFLNGHHEGGLQFAHSTWVAAGGLRFAPHAYEARPVEQIRAAYDLTRGSVRGISWHWAQTVSGCL